jgi:hypothetical protein
MTAHVTQNVISSHRPKYHQAMSVDCVCLGGRIAPATWASDGLNIWCHLDRGQYSHLKVDMATTAFGCKYCELILILLFWFIPETKSIELDGNWVSLRVNGHLGPSTLRGSFVGRIALTPEDSSGLISFCHLDWDNTFTSKVILATIRL